MVLWKVTNFLKSTNRACLIAHGSLIKPIFEKSRYSVVLTYSKLKKVSSSIDGILLPLIQSGKSKKELENQSHSNLNLSLTHNPMLLPFALWILLFINNLLKSTFTALDRANTESPSLSVPDLWLLMLKAGLNLQLTVSYFVLCKFVCYIIVFVT